MALLSVAPPAHDDARSASFLDPFQKRVSSLPPGTCPIALQLSLLVAAEVQTCGKCVPCRDGIPQMVELMQRVLNCAATSAELVQLRALALFARDESDCAIGYQAGELVLQGLEQFEAEYESHVHDRTCQAGIGQTVPCETLCPAHVNVPGYISLVQEGDPAGAVAMVRKDNPFPTACALICEHPCETRCRRGIIDAPVNIRGIKKYAVDNAAADTVPVPERLPDSGRRIAVIGAGPSGMTCAYFASLMGHEVHVFEARKQAGGMMRYGIPKYRFPRERLDEDLNAIMSVGGITLHTETDIGTKEMRELAEAYDAVYVAIGAQAGKTLHMEGADAEGVHSAVDMLGRIGDEEYPDLTGKNVVVIGGGNVAMDCARTAIRLGTRRVTVAYRRRLEDMTALPEEVEAAIAEGVEMFVLKSPERIEVDDAGHCTALVCQPQLISTVKGGRPSPKAAAKPKERIAADVILVAVGQDIVSEPFAEFGLPLDRSRFVTDDNLRAHGYDNIFVGGDCQTGPLTVIAAIGAGKVAARNIDEYLGFHHKLDCGVEAPPARENDRTPCGRVTIAERRPPKRKLDFDCVELEMSVEEVEQECGRCLRCDVFGCGSMEGGRVLYE